MTVRERRGQAWVVLRHHTASLSLTFAVVHVVSPFFSLMPFSWCQSLYQACCIKIRTKEGTKLAEGKGKCKQANNQRKCKKKTPKNQQILTALPKKTLHGIVYLELIQASSLNILHAVNTLLRRSTCTLSLYMHIHTMSLFYFVFYYVFIFIKIYIFCITWMMCCFKLLNVSLLFWLFNVSFRSVMGWKWNRSWNRLVQGLVYSAVTTVWH